MVVLHIARIDDNPFAGVNVAVPAHVMSQQKYVNAGLLNIANKRFNNIENQFIYKSGEFDICHLPAPFNMPDVAIFHGIYIYEFISISEMLRKKSIPYILLPHGSLTKEAQHKKYFKKVTANLLIFNRFIKKSKARHFLSEREQSVSIFNDSSFVVPNGMTVLPERKTFFSSSGCRMIYIGRLEIAIKGLDLLLKAFGELRDFLIDNECVLDIYGPDDGCSREISDMIYNYDLQDIVRLHSAVSGDEKKAVLLSGDCFIQSSRSEGVSLGLLEALSYGLPCIATKGTGMAEQIEAHNAGWGCETNVQGIKEAVSLAVLQKDSYKRKSENAASWIADEYAWDKVAEKTLNCYRTVIHI